MATCTRAHALVAMMPFRGQAHTQGLEGFWSYVKRGLADISMHRKRSQVRIDGNTTRCQQPKRPPEVF